MNRALILLLVLAAPAVAPAQDKGKPKGVITGTITAPGGATAVAALDRAEDAVKRYPGKIDSKTGKFTIADLPLGADYDLVLDFGRSRLEGVNLKVLPSDFEEEMPLSKEDKAA